ncbi:MAG: hypothetical protein ABJC79_02290 [Acidimicrobiia bacterium]
MEAAPARPTRFPFWRRMLPWALCALPVLIYAFQAWDHRWILDDGFINFRVVRQIEAGNGPVFNAGQRVEAFTSPFWILVLTVGDVLAPVRLELLSVLLGISCAVAGLGFAVAGSARLWKPIDPEAPLMPAGVLVYIALYPMWYFATSGLETPMIFGWLGLCLFLLSKWASRPDARLSTSAAVVIGLGWLIRPDLLPVTLALLAAVLVGSHDRSWRTVVKLLVAVFAVPVVYQLFRMGYYASLISNTAYAKKANATNWGRGADYLKEFVRTYELWIPLAAVALAGFLPLLRAARSRETRRTTCVALGFAVGGALVGLYVVRVGGDYIHARLLLPALFAICLPVAVLPQRWLSFAAVAIVVPWALVAAFQLRPDVPYRVTIDNRRNLINVEDVIEQPTSRVLALYQRGQIFWEQKRLPYKPAPELPRKTIARGYIGTTGYVVGPDIDVFDTLGLADALTARFRTSSSSAIPGHEKPIPAAWAAARLTDPRSKPDPANFAVQLFGLNLIEPLIPQTSGREFRRQVASVRRALECGDLKAFHDAYAKPLTIGRFFDNVGRSITSSSFSIPADPDQAVREFCHRR